MIGYALVCGRHGLSSASVCCGRRAVTLLGVFGSKRVMRCWSWSAHVSGLAWPGLGQQAWPRSRLCLAASPPFHQRSPRSTPRPPSPSPPPWPSQWSKPGSCKYKTRGGSVPPATGARNLTKLLLHVALSLVCLNRILSQLPVAPAKVCRRLRIF